MRGVGLLALLLRVLAAGGLRLHVYPNGQTTGNNTVVLGPEDAGLAPAELLVRLTAGLQQPAAGELVAEDATVFAVVRGNLRSDALVAALASGDRLVAVPLGRRFLRPVFDLGRPRPLTVPGAEAGQPIVLTALAAAPRLFHATNLVTEAEMRFLTEAAAGQMARSTVGMPRPGHNATLASGRTSHNAWINEGPEQEAIKARAMRVLSMPHDPDSLVQLIDGLQVLRYREGELYNMHYDYFTPDQLHDPPIHMDAAQGGSNRFATVFIYLTTPELGGQTAFAAPRAPDSPAHPALAPPFPPSADAVAAAVNRSFPSGGWQAELVQRCFDGVAVYPRRGDAIIFYSQDAFGHLDESSMHAGCPVLAGEKWAANLWAWNNPRLGGDRRATALSLHFVLGSGLEAARVHWREVGTGQLRLVGELARGEEPRFTTHTQDTHVFVVEAREAGAPADGPYLRVGEVTAVLAEGSAQDWLITPAGATRVRREVDEL